MKTVVIIDDHEMIRAGLAASLNGCWRILGEAGSLKEAKALFASLKEAPDIILLDIVLKGDWGLDLIQKKQPGRKSRAGASHFPPVLVYSVYDDYAHVNAAIRSGAKGYVCKSQGVPDLLEAMEALVSGKTVFPSSLVQRMTAVSDLMLALTKREREVFNKVQRGFTNKEIAEALNVSIRTIENNLSILYDKMGVKNRRELERL
ncbi:MAG: response regulator transcription factor [Treponema sp.]|nr:response regulator transcription factor [Treponema sp.]